MDQHDTRNFLILIRGQIDLDEIQPNCPVIIEITTTHPNTEFTVQTDQSGLIGLLRHLHARGLVLLELTGREIEGKHENQNNCSQGFS
ncbi:MAG: hypothetical protein JXA13_03390 [Anaerolineales bacterium]|nr:hypothetical protein [Anaerolineales bacterium]